MIEQKANNDEVINQHKEFKLNYKRTIIIGFAYFGIFLLWLIYDAWCPTFLTELFLEALPYSNETNVQYLVGIMMAFDNLAALIMLPLFGRLSDRTHTRIGKRMPYILVGTFVSSIIFPFIPLLYHYHNLVGVILTMAITVFFATIYRNPVVALMPDMTPKPLRSKANGVISIMGYIGGVFATGLAFCFSLSEYNEYWADGIGSGNVWLVESPFLIASILMIVSVIVLLLSINENKIAIEMKDEILRGEKVSETEISLDDNQPMSKANKIMLWTILGAEFLWYMADNGINTFMGNYTIYYLLSEHRSNMINTIVGGVASALGIIIGVSIASKIGRKWSIFAGLSITFAGFLTWLILSFVVPIPEANPEAGIYNEFPIYLYIIWFFKGLGMSIVNVNAFPMTVELCTNDKIGIFTGYYFASAMAAQTITPIALGSLLLIPGFTFKLLPLYASILIGLSAILFLFIKNVRRKKVRIKKGLEAFSDD